MTYTISRGKDRRFCDECKVRAAAIAKETRSERMNYKPCSTNGCTGKANRVSYGLCEACYGRLRRNGSTAYVEYTYRTYNDAGYAKVKEPQHILADSTGTVYEHRFVYYNSYGNGPFNCHWCNKDITWGTLHIDHLDDNNKNNNINNLVASCPICNQARGRNKVIKTMRDRYGIKLSHNGVTKTVKEWADDLGIHRNTIHRRLELGWSVVKAVTEPRGKSGPQRSLHHKIKSAKGQ